MTIPAVKRAAEEEAIDGCAIRCMHPEHLFAVRRNRVEAEVAARVASLFGVLADPTRVIVVYALLQAPDGELCVCNLASGLGRDDTTISRHSGCGETFRS